MKNTYWILIDTETTGLTEPIFVVELGAQKMLGWLPEGPPFRRLLNQNVDIPSEATRVNGYTREILERDGESALTVYRDFAAYVGNLPIVAFNLKYDLDKVLIPEWARLGIKPIGTVGFCALKLAQRLLDPVPAGNCKLQTLRQYYRLPERGAHTALGDVESVADLMNTVLRPIAQARSLTSWRDICAYLDEEWFPSRIAFGKFKGRHFQDAVEDKELFGWLTWLTESTNARTSRMGTWYLAHLVGAESDKVGEFASQAGNAMSLCLDGSPGTDIAVFLDVRIEELRQLIDIARSRLAEVEVQYTVERHAVDMTQAAMFNLLRKHYQSRDRLKLIIKFRQSYLDKLMELGEEEAEQVVNEYESAKAKSDDDYEKAASTASNRKELSPDDEAELKILWKKLVRMYHPDKFAHQPDKIDTYNHLTSVINKARDEGDIALLREIANDVNGYILRAGWSRLDFSDDAEIKHLRRLLETLQFKIVETMESINVLHTSAEFELSRLCETRPDLLEQLAADQSVLIEAEVTELEIQANKLKDEISVLAPDVF